MYTSCTGNMWSTCCKELRKVFHIEFNYQEHVCKSPVGTMKSASGMVEEYVQMRSQAVYLAHWHRKKRKGCKSAHLGLSKNKPPTGQMIAHVPIKVRMLLYFMKCLSPNLQCMAIHRPAVTKVHCIVIRPSLDSRCNQTVTTKDWSRGP